MFLKIIILSFESIAVVLYLGEHEREQPDNPGDTGLVLEGGDEAGKIDLCLMAGRGLEAKFEGFGAGAGPDGSHEALYRRVGAALAAFA